MPDGPFRDIGRRQPARGVHLQLGRPNWVWATLCTARRHPWLANAGAHARLRETWRAASKWLVTDYILMPDHAHFFAAPQDFTYPFEAWVTYWERQFRKLHTHPDWRWQPHPFHHRLRDGESYAEKWRYLRENPVRRSLVQSADEWPYQGRIHEIAWPGD